MREICELTGFRCLTVQDPFEAYGKGGINAMKPILRPPDAGCEQGIVILSAEGWIAAGTLNHHPPNGGQTGQETIQFV